MRTERSSVVCLLGMCLFCLSSFGRAQENVGSITGTVLDSSQAVVAGVAITVSDINRGSKFPVTSGASGSFTVLHLTVGQFRVEATKPGFKKFVQEPVSVYTGSATTVNITLEVGAVTQQVNVVGSTALLQTTDAAVGAVMTNKMYQELPLTMNSIQTYGSGRRQVEQFILTEPGVTSPVEGDILAKTFNGNQYYSTNVMIDGVGTTTSLDGGEIEFTSPPYDAMEEFKVQSSNLPAEFGTGFGVENLTMRSGTNRLHGSLYEFLRNDAMDARGFLPKPAKAQLNMNEFGGTVGGPVSIPKIYNGRDRTFFFVTVEDYRQRGAPPSAPSYTVPTAAERQGDMSALLLPANGGIQIYDPATTTLNPATGKYVRTPFPGNIIPPNRIAPQVALYLPHIRPATTLAQFGNFTDNLSAIKSDWVWSAKLDHTFSGRNRISWSYWGDDTANLSHGDDYSNLSLSLAWWHGGGHRLHDYFTISPNLQNDAYAGYTEVARPVGCGPGTEIDTVNPANILNQQYYAPLGLPAMQFAGTGTQYFRSGGGIGSCITMGAGVFRGQWRSNFRLGDIFDYIHGKHDIKFGGEAAKEYNTNRETAGIGINYSGLETNLPGTANTGDMWASFLLGAADSATLNGPNVDVQYHNIRQFLFVQDTWKMTPKFTVNYGVRYDLPYLTTESHNNMSGFNPAAPNPGAGNIPGALIFLGSGPGRTGGSAFPGNGPSRHEFGPRIGFAYQFDSKTVIRAGYGLMFAYGNGSTIGFDEGGSPFQAGLVKYSLSLSSPNQGVTPAVTLAGGLPLPPSTLPVINPALENGTSPYYWDPNSGFEPYVQQATLGIQRYLAVGFFVSATYVGQKGNHLQGNQDYLNQLPVADLAMGTLLTQPYNSATAVAAGIKAPYAGFSGSVAQAIRPFPQYLNILNRFDGSGKNRYDALQVQVRKQIGDLQVAVNFTGSKNLSDTRPGEFSGSPGAALDTHNLRLEKAVANNDASRVLTGTWLYELPAGKGKRLAGGAHGVLNQVVSGWQVGAIQTYRNGLIRGVTGGVPLPIFSITTRPDMIQGAHVQLQNCSNLNLGVSVIANINAFTANGPFQLGTAPRNLPAYRGCAWMDEDFTLQKRVALRESAHLEFRGEFYNIFNRHKFADPALNFNSPGSFGKITGIDGQFQPRIVQVGMKLIF